MKKLNAFLSQFFKTHNRLFWGCMVWWVAIIGIGLYVMSEHPQPQFRDHAKCFCRWVPYVFVAPFALLGVLMILDWRKLATLSLVLIFGFTSISEGRSQALLPDLPEPEFPPGLIEQVPEGELHASAMTCKVIAIVIVVSIVVWIVITIKRLSDQIPPPPPPDEEGAEGDTDAGSYVIITEEHRIDYEFCTALAAASGATSTAIQLDIAIEETPIGPTARLKMGQTYTGTLVDTEGLKESAAKWGLDLDPNVAGAQYTHNGQPVNPWESPISFQHGPHGVIPTFSRGGVPHPVVIDESEDLQHWEFLFEMHVETGRKVRLVDTSPSHQRFYRIRTALK